MNMLFVKGVMTGFVLSLPFGPIGIYCMEKTLVQGEKEGYTSAMGMVSVDFIYGMISFLFINILRNDIEKYGPLLTSIVGVFLISVGVKKFFKHPEAACIKDKKDGLFQHYLTTFLVALVNISTILVIIGVYSITNNWFKISPDLVLYMSSGIINRIISAFIFASGIFIGGGALWFVTTYILYHWRKKITHELLIKITKFSGLALLGFGIFTLATALKHFLILQEVIK